MLLHPILSAIGLVLGGVREKHPVDWLAKLQRVHLHFRGDTLHQARKAGRAVILQRCSRLAMLCRCCLSTELALTLRTSALPTSHQGVLAQPTMPCPG